MSTFTKFQPFVEKLAEKSFNLGSDTLKVALTNTVPLNTYSQLSQITEIDYTNLSSRNLTIASSLQSSGTYKLTLDDLTLAASGVVPAFRYVVIYDDTSTNDELICWYDYGSELNLTTGDELDLDMDESAGFLTLA